jgi:hypothetical protein
LHPKLNISSFANAVVSLRAFGFKSEVDYQLQIYDGDAHSDADEEKTEDTLSPVMKMRPSGQDSAPSPTQKKRSNRTHRDRTERKEMQTPPARATLALDRSIGFGSSEEDG